MKKRIAEFLKRGLGAAGCGPLVLAVVYAILGSQGVIESLTAAEVSRGILSVLVMAFIAGGITVVYQSERLPLSAGILIHAGVLYLDYLVIYLINGWMRRNLPAIGIFTAIFVAGYALIWLGIYWTIRRKTDRSNRKLHEGGCT